VLRAARAEEPPPGGDGRPPAGRPGAGKPCGSVAPREEAAPSARRHREMTGIASLSGARAGIGRARRFGTATR
jgi:hypothetical protein